MSYAQMSSSRSVKIGSVSGGVSGGGGSYDHCGVGGFGGDFSQAAGSYGQVASGFSQAAGGYNQAVGYGYGGGAFYGQGAGGGFGGAGGAGHGGAGGAGHGGAGGAGFGGGGADAGFGGGDSLLHGNEKQEMQNLNNRLAAYLGKVHQLEAANAELEQNIKEFLEKQRSGGTKGEAGKDYTKYFTIIADVQSNIIAATNTNANLVLQYDNARLAADDFKMKFDNECALRQSVEADIHGLRKVKDDLTMCTSDLESQLEGLTEEMALLKKNHQEEIKGSHGAGVGDVNVELNAAPGNNLLKEMNNLREQYEAMAEKNRKEAEEQFKKASEGLKKEISTGVEQITTSKSEISELKKTLQALQIELQSQLAMKKSLEENLAQTEGQYCMKLSQIQAQIAAIEGQLAQLRADMECHNSEYADLMDAKTKLENEIGKYRTLLDGESGTGQTGSGSGSTSGAGSGSTSGAGSGSGATKGTGSTSGSTSGSQGGTKRTQVVKQIIEEYLDGKVVSTRVEEKEIPIDH